LLERSVPLVMEFTPHRLIQSRRLEPLRSLLDGHYTHVADLRIREGEALEVAGLDALNQLAERYASGFTDLVVFRLPSGLPRAA
jgi:hypothetical protein